MLVGIAVLVAFILCGCKSVHEVPVMHDTVYINNDVYRNIEKHDSIYVHDSVWMTIKGDTVIVDRWHTRYKERVEVDTMRVHDTVYKAKEVPVEVVKEKKVPVWWPLWLLAGIAAAAVCRHYFKPKK